MRAMEPLAASTLVAMICRLSVWLGWLGLSGLFSVSGSFGTLRVRRLRFQPVMLRGVSSLWMVRLCCPSLTRAPAGKPSRVVVSWPGSCAASLAEICGKAIGLPVKPYTVPALCGRVSMRLGALIIAPRAVRVSVPLISWMLKVWAAPSPWKL